MINKDQYNELHEDYLKNNSLVNDEISNEMWDILKRLTSETHSNRLVLLQNIIKAGEMAAFLLEQNKLQSKARSLLKDITEEA